MKDHFAYAVAALVWGFTLTASAQVYRCKTATGGTEYSQVPCGKDAELLQNRNQSIDTRPFKDPFDWIRREEEGRRAQAAAERSMPVTDSRSPACIEATNIALQATERKSPSALKVLAIAASICGRHDIAAVAQQLDATPKATEPERRSTFVPGRTTNPNPSITNCDPSGCWDTNGGRYNRAAGNTFFGPNGVACTATAGGLVCP